VLKLSALATEPNLSISRLTKASLPAAKVKALHAKIGELTVTNGTANMRDAPGITVSLSLSEKLKPWTGK
jgi:hypothetical protein